MSSCGLDGVLVRLIGHIGLSFGSLLERVGGFSRHIRLEVGDGFKI